jgi:periplasmic copper chaperone A
MNIMSIRSFLAASAVTALAIGLGLSAGQALAQNVEVKNAWVRTSVPGQQGTGAFMSITAKDGARLVGASSPVAGVTEVHEMKMEGDVMKMRAIPGLDLPAGKAVDLKPGGFHVMLMDLKAPLAIGSTVPITLQLKDAKGADSQVTVQVPVSARAPGGGNAKDAHSEHKH